MLEYFHTYLLECPANILYNYRQPLLQNSQPNDELFWTISNKAKRLKKQGLDNVSLTVGEPDFDTPQHIKDAAIKAINDNWSHYTPVAGFADLREAVCTKLKRDNNLDYAPENIVTSTGAKQSLANAILALVQVYYLTSKKGQS